MEPGLSRGDLVLVRGGSEPDVGDVVLYRDPTLGVRVLHRVIAKEDGRLVLQGDANDFVDDARPRPSDVIGSFWFSIPRAGSMLFWLQQPLHAALLAFALADRRARRGVAPRRDAPEEARSRMNVADPFEPAAFPLVPLVLFLGVVLTASTVVPTSKAGRSTDASPRTTSSRPHARRSR